MGGDTGDRETFEALGAKFKQENRKTGTAPSWTGFDEFEVSEARTSGSCIAIRYNWLRGEMSGGEAEGLGDGGVAEARAFWGSVWRRRWGGVRLRGCREGTGSGCGGVASFIAPGSACASAADRSTRSRLAQGSPQPRRTPPLPAMSRFRSGLGVILPGVLRLHNLPRVHPARPRWLDVSFSCVSQFGTILLTPFLTMLYR